MEPVPSFEHMKTDHYNWTYCCWCVTKVRRCLGVTAAQMGRDLGYHQLQVNVEGRRVWRPGSRTERHRGEERRAELQGEKSGRKMKRWPVVHMTSPPRPITALGVPLDPPQFQPRGICPGISVNIHNTVTLSFCHISNQVVNAPQSTVSVFISLKNFLLISLRV